MPTSRALDWQRIEQEYRVGQLTIKEIARQHGVTDSGIRKHAKANGWTRDLTGAMRARVRESLVREAVRANQCELIGVAPSDEAIIDEAAAVGVAVVRSHRRDIDGLRKAAAGLLKELCHSHRPPDDGPPQADGPPQGVDEWVPIPVTQRSRVIADLSQAMARLIPLERTAFGLDEEKPPDPYAALSDGDLNRRIDALLAETRASEASRRTVPPPAPESTRGLPALP